MLYSINYLCNPRAMFLWARCAGLWGMMRVFLLLPDLHRYPKMQENPESATGTATATGNATATATAVAPRTDRLELVKELPRGSVGVVHQARNPQQNRSVVLRKFDVPEWLDEVNELLK